MVVRLTWRTAKSNMPEHSDEQLLTYAELAERLGISPDGARIRAKRKNWRHERNDPSGPMRVRVPSAALPEHPPERSPEKRTNSTSVRTDIDERLNELAANVAEIRANMTRTAGVEAELRAELANARERAAVAEAQLEAERGAAEDRVAARNAVNEELRAELARLRLPFRRRWIG